MVIIKEIYHRIFKHTIKYNMAPSKKKGRNAEEKEKHAEKERERRRRMKNDSAKCAAQKLKENARYLKKKDNKVIKPIKEMTPRAQRAQRKKWAINAKNYRKNKKHLKEKEQQYMADYSPPGSPTSSTGEGEPPPDNQDPVPAPAPVIPKLNQNGNENILRVKKKLARKYKSKLAQKDKKIAELKASLRTYQKKLVRMKMVAKGDNALKPSPNSRVAAVCNDNPCSSSPEVKRKLLFAEVMQAQSSQSYSLLKQRKEKRILQNLLTGRVTKKYKFLGYCRHTILKGWNVRVRNVENSRLIKQKDVRNSIQRFLEQDINSRMCAAKKEYVTKSKQTHQKRFLTNTLKNLHKKYLVEANSTTVSYSAFCRNRPFWIKEMKISNRDTCKCIKHANMELIIVSLHKSKVLSQRTANDIIQTLSCPLITENCLFRSCPTCKGKVISYNEFDITGNGDVFKWAAVKETYTDIKTKTQKLVSKMSKLSTTKPLTEIISDFEQSLTPFLEHQGRVIHQYTQMNMLKDKIKSNECLIHMDFSENYCLKYAEETQALHFGGSRQQISLHTVVTYTKSNGASTCTPKSYCTLSESLAHGPSAIWCHLKPILDALPDKVQTVHFLSDGPATQYKNKTMFYILATKLKLMFPKLKNYTWNYLESGHGKGAADGVGAVCKRTADRYVGQGHDIADFNTLFDVIKENCPNITIFKIFERDIKEFGQNIDPAKAKQFVGTMKVHQVVGSIESYCIWLRSLSCFNCTTSCDHHHLGHLDFTPIYSSIDSPASSIDDGSFSLFEHNTQRQLKYNEVYSSDSDEDALQSSAKLLQNSKKVLKKNIKTGTHILIKLTGQNTKKFTTSRHYTYAAICQSNLEDNDVKVLLFKSCASTSENQLFKLNESDVSYINFEQIISILPTPNIVLQGNRVYYKFPGKIDVN